MRLLIHCERQTSCLGPSSGEQRDRDGIYYWYLLCTPLLRALDLTKNRGQRSWSVGLSLADITHTVLTGRHKVHSISTLAQVEQHHPLWRDGVVNSSHRVTLDREVIATRQGLTKEQIEIDIKSKRKYNSVDHKYNYIIPIIFTYIFSCSYILHCMFFNLYYTSLLQ